MKNDLPITFTISPKDSSGYCIRTDDSRVETVIDCGDYFGELLTIMTSLATKYNLLGYSVLFEVN